MFHIMYIILNAYYYSILYDINSNYNININHFLDGIIKTNIILLI